MKKLNIGIIGFGLIGKKRYFNRYKSKLIAISDKKKIDLKFSKFQISNEDLISNKLIDAVFICTTHSNLFNLSLSALNNNKHVLVEKPGSLKPNELKKLINISEKKKLIFYVGYNLRFHPAILKSQEIINKKLLGSLMYLKISYGHGGRLNYGNEWRFIEKISGGGELIDKGSHLIDLSIMFLGKFKYIQSNLKNYYWHKKLDDNSFMTLENSKKQVALLHASSTEWKNEFVLEIYGKRGKIKVTGIGGSYGKEKCIFYKMLKKMGPPKIIEYDYSKLKDVSWYNEMKIFYNLIKNKKYKIKKNYEHLEVLKIINKIYSLK